MTNIKNTSTGRINRTGLPGSPGAILPWNHPELLDEIEDGIKPLVQACMEIGLHTQSSCEGHIDGDITNRCNCVVDSGAYEHTLRRLIKILELRYGRKIVTLHHQDMQGVTGLQMTFSESPANREELNADVERLAAIIREGTPLFLGQLR